MNWDLEPSPLCHLTFTTSCPPDWVLSCPLSCAWGPGIHFSASTQQSLWFFTRGDLGGCWKIRLGFVVAAFTALRQQHHGAFWGDLGSPGVILQTPGSGGHLVGAPAAGRTHICTRQVSGQVLGAQKVSPDPAPSPREQDILENINHCDMWT